MGHQVRNVHRVQKAKWGRGGATLVWALLIVGIAGPSVAAQCEVVKLVDRGTPVSGARLGSSVAVEDQLLVAGAPRGDDAALGPGAGTVLVARHHVGGWVQEAFPPAGDPPLQIGSRYGESVALSKGVLAVGAPGATHTNPHDGLVRLYEHLAGHWTLVQELPSPFPVAEGEFGAALAMDGELLVVGQPGALAGKGRATIFRRVEGDFVHEITLTGNLLGQPATRDFGRSVAVSSSAAFDLALFGAPLTTYLDSESGVSLSAISWNSLPAAGWTLHSVTATGGMSTHTGAAVAASGFWRSTTSPGASIPGFLHDFGSFSVSTQVVGVDAYFGVEWGAHEELQLGLAVAISGSRLAVSTRGFDPVTGVGSGQGAVILYELPELVGNLETAMLTAQGELLPYQEQFYPLGTAEVGDEFGAALGMHGDWLVVGAPGDDVMGRDTGAVHVYDLARRAWNWIDLGPANTAPVLVGEGALCGNDLVRLTLHGTAGGVPGLLFVGNEVAPQPFLGGQLLPATPAPGVVVPLTTDATGVTRLEGRWPAEVPSEFTVVLQAWVLEPEAPGGVAGSNSLVGTTP